MTQIRFVVISLFAAVEEMTEGDKQVAREMVHKSQEWNARASVSNANQSNLLCKKGEVSSSLSHS
jgi:hypothetical protein